VVKSQHFRHTPKAGSSTRNALVKVPILAGRERDIEATGGESDVTPEDARVNIKMTLEGKEWKKIRFIRAEAGTSGGP
jgi:hypothetical protein